nr:hypothetical protein LGRDSM20601_p0063 [Listeria grayi]CBV37304.1 hypothetical protein LGRDSM20601_p0079 [Listeria grayi]
MWKRCYEESEANGEHKRMAKQKGKNSFYPVLRSKTFLRASR